MSFDISLELYKVFCTVVKTRSMTLAAKELFISQPAVSMSIKQLEDKLEKPLLIRTPKGVQTTPEGSVLYEYLSQALSLVDMAEKKYSEMAKLQAGEIKIGASDTILSQYLIGYIKEFIGNYPEINIKITNKTSYETIHLLKIGQVDIGFVNLPIENEAGIEVLECISINDCIIGGAKFKNLATKGINLKEISSYPLMMLEKESNSRKYVDNFAKSEGIVIEPNIELASHDLLVSFAKINLGLAMVIKEFTINEIDGKTIFQIPLYPPIPYRHIGLVKLKYVGLSYASSKFLDIVLKH